MTAAVNSGSEKVGRHAEYETLDNHPGMLDGGQLHAVRGGGRHRAGFPRAAPNVGAVPAGVHVDLAAVIRSRLRRDGLLRPVRGMAVGGDPQLLRSLVGGARARGDNDEGGVTSGSRKSGYWMSQQHVFDSRGCWAGLCRTVNETGSAGTGSHGTFH